MNNLEKTILNIAIIIFIFLAGNLKAQYDFDWSKGFGGDRKDKAKCIIEASDGNLILGGKVIKKGTHLWIVKLSTDGKEIWGRTYENSFSSGANAILEVPDTCFIVAGFITKDKELQNTNGWILKTDFSGNVLWEKEYGEEGYEEIKDIIHTKDGGFLAVGYSQSNEFIEKEIWIFKTDATGNVQWTKMLKASSEDVANAVVQTSDGGFVVVGYAYIFKKKVMRVMKFDQNGNDVWDMPLREDAIESANDVLEMPDNTLFVVGKRRHKTISNFDAMIYKISANGDSIVKKTFGYERWEEATSITKTYEGKIAVSGYSKADRLMDSNFWLKIIDEDCNVLWKNDFKRKSLDFADAITECQDNGLAIAGATYHTDHGWDYAVLKYKSAEKTRLHYVFPSDSVSSVSSPKIDLDICVTSYEELKNVEIFVNGTMQRTGSLEADFLSSADCKYPLFANVKLKEGLNKITIIVTDVKDLKVTKETVIYYIPDSDVSW